MPQQDRLKKLAEKIDALMEKDTQLADQTRKIGVVRREAAVELHRACSAFVAALNSLARRSAVTLDPAEYFPESFQEDGPNLFQINVRGRILQIELEVPDFLISTEDFRVPYVLKGSIRCFNQQLLDHDIVEEQLVFYCLEKKKTTWRFFDARTYRTGQFDQDYLVSLMEHLV